MADRTPSFFDFDGGLAQLSAKDDNLDRVKALVDFEMFRPAWQAAAPRADRSKGGRPPSFMSSHPAEALTAAG